MERTVANKSSSWSPTTSTKTTENQFTPPQFSAGLDLQSKSSTLTESPIIAPNVADWMAEGIRGSLSNSQQTSSASASNGGIGFVQRTFQASQANQPAPVLPIQTKLTIGEPGDNYEHETERVESGVLQRLHASRSNTRLAYTQPSNNEFIQRIRANAQQPTPEYKPTTEVRRFSATNSESARVPTQSSSRGGEEGTIQRLCSSCKSEEQQQKEIQTKLTIGQPGDKYEEEADRVAAQVISMAEPSNNQPIQRETEEVQPKPLAASIMSLVQRATESEGNPHTTSNLENQLNGSKGGGSPLAEGVRGFMEARFGADFSQVKVHTDQSAIQMNKGIGAQAFTHGSDIYFGAGKSPGNNELTAHELTHVVQQTGVTQPKPITPKTLSTPYSQLGNNQQTVPKHLWMKEQAEDNQSTAPKNVKSFLQQSQGNSNAELMIQRSSWLDDLTDFGEEAGWKIVQELAPGLEPILRKGPGGITDWLKDLIGSSIEGVFNNFMAPVRSIAGIDKELTAHFAPLLTSMQVAAGKISQNDCTPIKEAAEKIEKTAESLITPIIEKLQPIVAKIKDFLNGLWDKIGAPIWGWIKEYAADQWAKIQWIGEKIQAVGSWIWKKTATIRSIADKMWTWLKNKLGIGEGAEGQDGLLQWMQRKVEAAWNAIKEKLEPFKKELTSIGLAIGGVALAISPAGPILVIGAAVAGAVQGLRWIAANWGKGNMIVQARSYLEKSLIPSLLGAANSLGASVKQMAGAISSALASLAAGVTRAVGAIGGSLLKVAVSAVQWIADQVTSLANWAQEQLNGLTHWLEEALNKLQTFLHKMLKFFVEVGRVVLDIWLLPAFLAKEVWNAVPECIRDPIVDFIGPIILRQIEIFKALANDKKAWQQTKEDVKNIVKLVFKDHDLMGAVKATFNLILRVFNIPPDMLTTIATKAESAWDVVSKNPLEFIKNTVRAIGHGFRLLWKNIGEHLKFGLVGWLTGGLAEKNITLPESWTDPKAVFGFVLDVLGFSVDHMWKLLEQRFDPETVKKARKRIGQVTEVIDWIYKAIDTTKSPQENARGIIDQAKDFGGSILTGIAEWIATQVAEELAILAAAAAASGGLSEVLDVVRRIYKGILTAVRWARRILDMVNDTLDNINDIAGGALETVGAKFEQIMHRGMPVVIGFLADQIGLGGIGSAIHDIIDKLREQVDKAILWVIDKMKAGIEALIGAVKQGVSKLGKFFGVRETFTSDDGESHAIYYEDRGGESALIVASTPRSIKDFLDFYIQEYEITPESDKGKIIKDIRNYLKIEIEPVIKQLKKTNQEEEKASKQGELLEKNKELSEKLRSLLAGDKDVGKIIDSYLLEGLTGTYSSAPTPTGDQLTPDHQPQAAIFEWAADQPFFQATSNMVSRAAGRASQGHTINLYKKRHTEGRTFGSKGSQTKNNFINKAKGELKDLTINQEKRNLVVDLMKVELNADVNWMKDIANKDNKNTNVWGDIHALNINKKEQDNLINKIRVNILQGESQIQNQNLESLKR